MIRASVLLLLSVSATLSAAPPSTPAFIEPGHDNQIVSGADVHMVTTAFSDSDGDAHRCTDWEIVDVVTHEAAWQASCVEEAAKIHIHLGDGTFSGPRAQERELLPGTLYRVRARHRDDSGNAETEWSAWGERLFVTSVPPVSDPMRLRDVLASPPPRWSIEPPSGASLRIEQLDEVPLLEIRKAGATDEEPLSSRSDIRLVVTSGETLWRADESELTIEDENGEAHTIYLPAFNLIPFSSAWFWVSANGSTHFAEAEERAPDFERIARGAPVPYRVKQKGFVVEHVAGDFSLPVNIAFVPDPGDQPDSPLFYVVELYGEVKVVTRSGEVRDFATGLLDFDPTGHFPGSGESGVAGLVLDPLNGDLYITRVSWPDRSNRDLIPEVVRLRPAADGLRANQIETIRTFTGEKQSASHQISNISIGPDRMLYVHFGDATLSEVAQDMSTVRGKIVRMNLDGSAPPDNPFYDAGDGIDARDYIYALGFRNPFGGAWRAEDQSLYEIENGPSVDRLARVVAGRNYGWDGTDESMSHYAICMWEAPAAPVQLAWVQRETFAGSGFPEEHHDTAFVTESGPTWSSGVPQAGKRISQVVIADDELVSGPNSIVEYDGTGKGTMAGIAAGPDGLYFTSLYRDFGYETPVDRGAAVYRLRWAGFADFDLRPLSGDGLTFEFLDRSSAPTADSWRWDFGDGTSSSERNPRHTFSGEGTYIVRQWVGENLQRVRKIRVGADRATLTAHFYARPDFTELSEVRTVDVVHLVTDESAPFSVRWSGKVSPRYSERYRFSAITDGDVRLTVNGQVLIDEQNPTGEIQLEAGREYDLVFEYRHQSGPATAQLLWESESQRPFAVPRSMVLPRRRSVR